MWLCEAKLKVKIAHFRLPSVSQKRACTPHLAPQLFFHWRSFSHLLGVCFVLQAEEMIHDIRQVFLANLEKVEWMDEETKQKAKDKVFKK